MNKLLICVMLLEVGFIWSIVSLSFIKDDNYATCTVNASSFNQSDQVLSIEETVDFNAQWRLPRITITAIAVMFLLSNFFLYTKGSDFLADNRKTIYSWRMTVSCATAFLMLCVCVLYSIIPSYPSFFNESQYTLPNCNEPLYESYAINNWNSSSCYQVLLQGSTGTVPTQDHVCCAQINEDCQPHMALSNLVLLLPLIYMFGYSIANYYVYYCFYHWEYQLIFK